MKFKAVLFASCLSLLSSAFAGSPHGHPDANNNDAKGTKNVRYPGYCQIEIVNTLDVPVHITGKFIDGKYLTPFDIRPYASDAVDVTFNGYCQGGMYLYIDTFNGYRVHGSYTPSDTTLYLEYSFGRKANAVAKAK